MIDKIIHIHDEDSEEDTCRKEVSPKLYENHWSDDLILEQRTFTDDKIVDHKRYCTKRVLEKTDYLLQ